MKKRRYLSLLTALAVAMTMLLGSVLPTAAASAGKYPLPSGATEYYYVDEDDDGNPVPGTWKKNCVESFAYDKKGNITKYNADYTEAGSKERQSTKWTYSKGKIKKSVTKSSHKGISASVKETITATFDKNQRLKKITSNQKGSNTAIFKPTKKGWITSRSWKGEDSYPDKMKYTFRKNGIPKKIVRTSSGDIPGQGTLHLNKKGLITSRSIGDVKDKWTYKYDKKGRVKSVTISSKSGDGKYKPFRKIVYRYGKASTTNVRVYIGVMNRRTPVALACRDVVTNYLTLLDY